LTSLAVKILKIII